METAGDEDVCGKEGGRIADKKNGDAVEGEWRVYCWGNIVGHVYLLLYLASERRIKGLRASWNDAGGETIIVMASIS